MIKPLPMRLQCICYITVGRLFAEFTKATLDVPASLRWKDFLTFASNDCKRQVYLNTTPNISPNTQLRQQKQAEKLGYDFGKILMKDAGYV